MSVLVLGACQLQAGAAGDEWTWVSTRLIIMITRGRRLTEEQEGQEQNATDQRPHAGSEQSVSCGGREKNAELRLSPG